MLRRGPSKMFAIITPLFSARLNNNAKPNNPIFFGISFLAPRPADSWFIDIKYNKTLTIVRVLLWVVE